MELRRLNKRNNKVKKNWSKEGLEKRKNSSRKQMILDNPMKKENVKLKRSIKQKSLNSNTGRTHFKKGNPGGGFKGKKHSIATKTKLSINAKREDYHKRLKSFKKGNVPWNKGLTKKEMKSYKLNSKKVAK